MKQFIKFKDSEETRLDLDSIISYTGDHIKSNNKPIGYRIWLHTRDKIYEVSYTDRSYPLAEKLVELKSDYESDLVALDKHFNIS